MAKIDHHVELIGAGLGERACFRDLDRGGGCDLRKENLPDRLRTLSHRPNKRPEQGHEMRQRVSGDESLLES
jgi:hypothetical protein